MQPGAVGGQPLGQPLKHPQPPTTEVVDSRQIDVNVPSPVRGLPGQRGFEFSSGRVIQAAMHKKDGDFRLNRRLYVHPPQPSPGMLFRRQFVPLFSGADCRTNFFMRAVYFTSDTDDLALIRQSLAGQSEAFGTLITRYQKVMYTVALRMLGDPEDARDATQDAFVKAFQRLETFDTKYRFYSWMYRILVNECLNANRDRRPEEALDDNAEGPGTPFDSALESERREQIQLALLRLTPEYRTVVVLRHFAGQSYGEIAETLSIPEKTVKSRLYSARQRLGELLLGWKEHSQEAAR